jgi:hypothetical protein
VMPAKLFSGLRHGGEHNPRGRAENES